FHKRMKHLDIDCHLVREKSQVGLMQLLPIRSSNQLADIFTKGLPPRLFTVNSSKLKLADIYLPPACGG
ncbi:Copia protein, partial [Glycine soja]